MKRSLTDARDELETSNNGWKVKALIPAKRHLTATLTRKNLNFNYNFFSQTHTHIFCKNSHALATKGQQQQRKSQSI
jgi:hypothetical protein